MLRYNWQTAVLHQIDEDGSDKYGQPMTIDVETDVQFAIMGAKTDENPSGTSTTAVGYIRESNALPDADDHVVDADGRAWAITSRPRWITHPLTPVVGQAWRFEIKAAAHG